MKQHADALTIKRREYRAMLRQKRESLFLAGKVEAKTEKSSPRQLWRSIDTLLGRGRVPLCDEIDVEQFHQFFDEKVADVHCATSAATLLQFQAVTVDEVIAAVSILPDKCCHSIHCRPPPPPIYFPQHTKENNNYHGNKRTAEGYQRSHTAQ